MVIKTHLISGAGNTFHIVSELSNSSPTMLWSIDEKRALAQKICSKYFADGFIFLKNKENLTWNFFNNDGSKAEMCGNATRCVGFYLSEIIKDQKSDWILQTTAGPIQILKITANSYQVRMTPIRYLQSTKGFYCNTGVPHLVREVADLALYLNLKSEAAALRNDVEFRPQGTNVTYVQLLDDKNSIKAISYERGVEDFTQACGTGALAAAAFNLMKRGSLETQVEMPGGTLMMNLVDLESPVMIGPAELLGKYEYENFFG